MKYFDNRYKKREKLVEQATRLKNEVVHTKIPATNSASVLHDINVALYHLFPVYYTRISRTTGRSKTYRVVRKDYWVTDHPVLKAC